MLPNSVARRRWVVDPICALILLACVAGHLLHLRDGEALAMEDSNTYRQQAERPLADSRFWIGPKPPLYALWYKAVGAFGDSEPTVGVVPWTEPALPAAQTALSLLAFTMLAFACARTAYTRAGRRLLFALPLAVSLAPLVAKWNQMVMSESLSMSLFAVFVAAWYLYFRRPSWCALAAVAASAACWAAVRDTNAYTVAMIVPVAALASIGGWRKSAALCICLVAAFALANTVESRSDRRLSSFYSAVGHRILPHPNRVDFFAHSGMPTSSALAERSGKWVHDDNHAFYRDVRLQQFRDWSVAHGMTTYMRFLLAHPFYSLAAPATEIDETFLSRLGWAVHMDWSSPDEPLARWLAGALRWAVLLGYGAAILSAIALWRRRRLREAPWLLVPLGMALLSLPQLWMAWHGDPMGYLRHGLGAVLCFLLGSLLLWAAMADGFFARVRKAGEAPDGSAYWPNTRDRLGASAASLLAVATWLIVANLTKPGDVDYAKWDLRTDPAVKAVALNAPVVGDTYERGETIEATVIFDRVVDVTGSPQLALRIGSATRQASVDFNDPAHPGYHHRSAYRIGSATRQESDVTGHRTLSLLFRYAPVRADVDADGISIAADALTLNGGTIKLRTVAKDARLGLGDHAVTNDGDRKVNGATKLTAPRVDQVCFRRVPANDDTYRLGERIELRVDFDRPVTVTGSPLLALAIGQQTKRLPMFRFVRSTRLLFRHVVQAGDFDADGVSVFEGALTLNGGTVNDARDATMPARLTLRRPAGRYKVDGQGPPAVVGVR